LKHKTFISYIFCRFFEEINFQTVGKIRERNTRKTNKNENKAKHTRKWHYLQPKTLRRFYGFFSYMLLNNHY